MPPLFINSPESTKKGIASKAKLSNPVAIRCDIVNSAGSAGILTNIVNNDEIAILHATGVPMAKKNMKLNTNTITGIYSIITICLKYQKFYNIGSVLHLEAEPSKPQPLEFVMKGSADLKYTKYILV